MRRVCISTEYLPSTAFSDDQGGLVKAIGVSMLLLEEPTSLDVSPSPENVGFFSFVTQGWSNPQS